MLVEAKKYKDDLEKEINEDRIQHGKKPLKEEVNSTTKQVVKSTNDPDSAMFHKNEKEKYCV